MRVLKPGEQVACIPGLTLVPSVLDDTGEDGIQIDPTGATNVLNTGDVRVVRSGHAINRARK